MYDRFQVNRYLNDELLIWFNLQYLKYFISSYTTKLIDRYKLKLNDSNLLYS